jgi:nucleotide-binding universal stress UspA family protein
MAFRRILLATDFDEVSGDALRVAAKLARENDASIHVLYVLEALMYTAPDMAAFAEKDPRTHPEATRSLAAARDQLATLGVKRVEATIEYGIAVDVIVRYANDGRFDVLVIGSRRHGSTASYVVPRSVIPVLAVPRATATQQP